MTKKCAGFFLVICLLLLIGNGSFALVAFAADSEHFLDDKLVNWLRANVSPVTGLPLSYGFGAPPGDVLGRIGKSDSVTGIIERVMVKEGISIYDAALWQIVLAHTGRAEDLAMAAKPVECYAKGSLGEFDDIRTGFGRQPFVYDPLDPQAVTLDLDHPGRRGFLFRFINANGQFLSSDPLDGKKSFNGFPNYPAIHWEDWKPIAGENAWVVMAALHVLRSASLDGKADTTSDAFHVAEELARAAMILQADNGGVRMAPLGTYCHLVGVDPKLSPEQIVDRLDERARQLQRNPEFPGAAAVPPEYTRWYYDEISTENNFSWYAALRMLWQMTNDDKYRQAMGRIEDYLHAAWDPERGIFFQGMHDHDGRWSPNREPFATDVQNWAIAVLGPATIDAWFGRGAARRLWEQTKSFSGVVDAQGKLEGVGFTREHDRVSVEWSAGAILAVRRLAEYLRVEDPAYALALENQGRQMRGALDVLRYHLPGGRDAYSYSSRRGWIPFGWFSHDKDVLSTASTAWVALVDAGIDPFELR
ncbi:MAG: hypothetical protein HQL22_07290 [Candidatus Omnitrophica bacterium]|nr:hypothetical protein [Candidatus Omnitrophota bacterium]